MRKETSTRRVVLVVALLTFVAAIPAGSVGAADDLGMKTWDAKCASCHAKDGSGKTKMGEKFNLRDIRSDQVQALTDEELFEITSKGRDKMPAYEKKLSKEEIDALVAYMRKLAKK